MFDPNTHNSIPSRHKINWKLWHEKLLQDMLDHFNVRCNVKMKSQFIVLKEMDQGSVCCGLFKILCSYFSEKMQFSWHCHTFCLPLCSRWREVRWTSQTKCCSQTLSLQGQVQIRLFFQIHCKNMHKFCFHLMTQTSELLLVVAHYFADYELRL